MTQEREPRDGADRITGEQADGEVRPERPDEEQGSKGANHRLRTTEASFEYDPSKHRAREEGGEP